MFTRDELRYSAFLGLANSNYTRVLERFTNRE